MDVKAFDFGRAAFGALLVGVGVALLVSSVRSVPCVDCEEDPETTAAEVAEASADIVAEAEAVVAE